ncbi:ATP-binding cassette domain-containing protein [Nonomuraea sp. NPDC050451]|uniref:ATP-binding cassette domain-containing protein n=1 Tax=Nonomuraea sp. NPDC050451 TaxID=3364364 RepID=UPI0037944F55
MPPETAYTPIQAQNRNAIGTICRRRRCVHSDTYATWARSPCWTGRSATRSPRRSATVTGVATASGSVPARSDRTSSSARGSRSGGCGTTQTQIRAVEQHRRPGRSGREPLTLGAIVLGLPRLRVDEVLDLVGLTRAEGRRAVESYSLGMRQRLGIAHALLGKPRALVLDEPVNGLDPQGIHWMRALLRDLADAGCAVLLSSHLLHEVEQVADHIVVIGCGRVLVRGSIAELTRGRSLERTFLELTASTDRGRA